MLEKQEIIDREQIANKVMAQAGAINNQVQGDVMQSEAKGSSNSVLDGTLNQNMGQPGVL
jgi:hypothetical protein